MVPGLYNPPQDAASWAFFGALHMADHFQIAAQIFAKTQRFLPILPLNPIPVARIELLAWFQDHQAMHMAMNAAMGVSGSDLSLVDFTNPTQTTFWIENNAAEHEQIAEALTRYRPPQPQQQQQQSTPVVPQPLVPVQPQAGGVLSQGNVPILGQPQPNTQVQPQPSPTLQPQPGPAPSTAGQVFPASVLGLPTAPGVPFG